MRAAQCELGISGGIVVAVLAVLLDAACGRVHYGDSKSDGGAPGDTGVRFPPPPLDGEPREAGSTSVDARVTRDGSANTDAADAGAPPGFLLAATYGARLQVVGDREGNALVQWDVRGTLTEVRFARYESLGQRWTFPHSIRLDEAFLRDPHGSGAPVLLGTGSVADSGPSTTVLRRFESALGDWAAPQPLEGFQAITVDWFLAQSRGGDVHLTRPGTDSGRRACYWPREESIFEPCQAVPARDERVTAGTGAFLWEMSGEFAVRRFDPATRTWPDAVRLWPASRDAGARWLTLGPAGEALAIVWRYTTDQLEMEARRMNPEDGIWDDIEPIAKAPRYGPSNTISFPQFAAVTDARHQDFAAIAVPLEDDEVETRLYRYARETRQWGLSRTVNVMPRVSFELVGDDAGNVYAEDGRGNLLSWNTTTEEWADAPVGLTAVQFIPMSTGVLAVGKDENGFLTGYRHVPSLEEWVPLKSAPAGILPGYSSPGHIPFATARVGTDRGIIAWTVGGEVRASFVE